MVTGYVDQAAVKLDAQDNVSAVLKRVQTQFSETLRRAVSIGPKIGAVFAGIKAQIEGVVRSVSSFGGRLQGIGSKLAVGGGLLTGLFAGAVNAAGDLTEINNRFDALFADQGKAARGFAATLGEAVGRSQPQLLGLLSDFQGLATGLRMDEVAAREFSQEMTQATLDLASFNNLTDQEASERMLSALTGSSEVLRKFGVDISAAALKARGIGESATELEKVRERFKIISETLKRQNAWGDAEKTSGSYSNTMKRLGAVLQDAAASIGTALLPEVTRFADWSVSAAKGASLWIQQNIGLVKSVAAAAVGLTGLGLAVTAAGIVLSSIGAIITAVIATLTALFSPIGLITAAIIALTSSFIDFKGIAATLSTGFLSSWDSILSAIKKGDLKSAFELVTLEIRLAWSKMIEAMKFEWLLFRSKFADKFGLLDQVDVIGDINAMEAPVKAIEAQIKQLKQNIAKSVTQTVKDAVGSAAHHLLPNGATGNKPTAALVDPYANLDLSALQNDLKRPDIGNPMRQIEQLLSGISTRSEEATSAFVAAANSPMVDAVDRQTAVLEDLRNIMRDSPKNIGDEFEGAIEGVGVAGLNRT